MPLSELEKLDARDERGLLVCSLCDSMFYCQVQPRIVIGTAGIKHIICHPCSMCADCECEFDHLSEIVKTPSGNYCTDCAGNLLAELQLEKEA